MGCVNEADNMDKIKQMINKKTGMDREPSVWEITDRAPVQNSGVRIFQSTHDPEMDPMPVDYWILIDKTLYSASEAEGALKKKGVKDTEEWVKFLSQNKQQKTIGSELNITEEIRKRTIGASEQTAFDIRDVTNNSPYKIEGATYLISSHQFNIDPTPWNSWIVIDGKLRKGSEIVDILKEKNIFPKSKQEAIDIAKLIVTLDHRSTRVYPDFNAPTGTGAKKPSVTEKDGTYEVILYTSEFPYTWTVKQTIKLGEGVYEVKGDMVR